MRILKTEDYKKFKYYKENREVKLSHVENLVESINEKNLLAYDPIIVDENMKVIDGQHRLEAAKILKIPVYYIVAKDAVLEDLRLLNANVKKWTSADYLNFYAGRKKTDYVVMKNFVKKYNLSTFLSLHLLTYKTGEVRGVFNHFKQGKLQIPNIAFSRKAAVWLNKLKPYCEDNCWRGQSFAHAVCRLLDEHPEELLVTLEKKLQRPEKGDPITRGANSKQYIRQFEYTLNKGKRKSENYIRLF